VFGTTHDLGHGWRREYESQKSGIPYSSLVLDDEHRSMGLEHKDVPTRSHSAPRIDGWALDGGNYEGLTDGIGQPKVDLRFVGRVPNAHGREGVAHAESRDVGFKTPPSFGFLLPVLGSSHKLSKGGLGVGQGIEDHAE
jgi:hypothetical protein